MTSKTRSINYPIFWRHAKDSSLSPNRLDASKLSLKKLRKKECIEAFADASFLGGTKVGEKRKQLKLGREALDDLGKSMEEQKKVNDGLRLEVEQLEKDASSYSKKHWKEMAKTFTIKRWKSAFFLQPQQWRTFTNN